MSFFLYVTQHMLNNGLDKLQKVRDEWYKKQQQQRLDFVSSQEMYNKAVEQDPWMIEDVPDKFLTQEMCDKAVEQDPEILEYIPDHLIHILMRTDLAQRLCHTFFVSSDDLVYPLV